MSPSRRLSNGPQGGLAQLGERLAGSQKVRGSSPLSSTTGHLTLKALSGLFFWTYDVIILVMQGPKLANNANCPIKCPITGRFCPIRTPKTW